MYTHDIKFRLGDGSSFIDAEMGIDNKTKDLIYRFTATSEPLRDDIIDDFRKFANHVKTMGESYKGIKEVSIIKKE